MADKTVPDMLCVEPLSSPYSLLPRVQTYTLAAVLLLPLPRGWLFRAALAAFTTRTAIFAIDAAVQLHALSKPIGSSSATVYSAPLDVLVVSEMMGLAAAMATWLLLVSSRGAESAARSLVRLWAAVVSVGAILAFVAVAKFGRQTLNDPAVGNQFATRCQGEEVYTDWILGLPVQDFKVIGVMGWKIGWLELRVGVPGLVMASLALLALVVPRDLAVQISSGKSPTPLPVDLEQCGLSDAPIKEDRSVSPLWRMLGWLIAVAVPAIALLMVISAEQYFNTMSHGLPSAEEMTSAGQWGGWAAIGIVAAATLINAVREGTGFRHGGDKLSPTQVIVPLGETSLDGKEEWEVR
jgi:hypothetical protein